jgi:hypothetical protein
VETARQVPHVKSAESVTILILMVWKILFDDE